MKRAKVPVWSFDEVIEPTFNALLFLLAKKLAAKLNQQYFKQAINDAQVNRLIAAINQTSIRADKRFDIVFNQ